jgi:hypothetical protein
MRRTCASLHRRLTVKLPGLHADYKVKSSGAWGIVAAIQTLYRDTCSCTASRRYVSSKQGVITQDAFAAMAARVRVLINSSRRSAHEFAPNLTKRLSACDCRREVWFRQKELRSG